jgi:hypothetical protein
MKITIPSSLKDITLRQYQKYEYKLEELEKLEVDESLKIQSKISTLCGISMTDVLNIEMVDVWKISNILDNILRQEPELVEKVNLNGTKFGWLPELDGMKYGEFLDLNNNVSNWETMHIAMGVLYRPIIKEDSRGRYAVEDYMGDKYHEQIKDITMDVVVGSMVFFWNLGMDCVMAIHKSLGDKEMIFQKQVNLLESGVGLQQSMNYVTEMLQSLKK